MGNCVQGTGDNSDPDPKGTIFTEVPIGGTFAHPGYCDYTTTGTANCGGPEFVPGGNGDIPCTCKGLCNEGCINKLCKRVSYLGDPSKCCATSAKTLGKNQTCDPRYRSYATNDCDASMNTFCAIGDNLFSNPNCGSWFNQRLDAASSTLEAVCARPENINKPQCGCILARKDMLTKFSSGSKVAVECIDNRCTNGGWKTQQMKQNPCNVVNCEMNITDLKLIANSPVGNYNPSFVQQCKNEKDKIEAANPAPIVGKVPVISPTQPSTTDNVLTTVKNNSVYIGIAVAILILIILFVMFRKQKT